MKDKGKTKEQLINELVGLRQRLVELEASEAELNRAEKRMRLLSSAVEQSCEIEWGRAKLTI